MSTGSYRDLEVWQLSMQVAGEIYRLTDTLPKTEMFGLSSQLQRAAASVPANIAEGHARDGTKEFLRSLSIAQGSRAELETHLLLAKQLGFDRDRLVESLLDRVERIGRMLRGLQRSLRAKLEP